MQDCLVAANGVHSPEYAVESVAARVQPFQVDVPGKPPLGALIRNSPLRCKQPGDAGHLLRPEYLLSVRIDRLPPILE